MLAAVGLFICGWVFSWVVGSLAEYLVHVGMHKRIMYGKTHTFHHKAANGQGVWGEFVDYLLPTSPFLAILFGLHYFVFDTMWMGVGTVLGGIWFCGFSAYTHQLSHERPELIFWLRFPVHHIHHYHNMWRHNFGVTTLLWDRLFGTYQDTPFAPTRKTGPLDFFRIHWISENPLEEYHKHDEIVLPDA